MGSVTRAQYRKLHQDQQREIARRLQETAEAINLLYPVAVRVAVCRKCRAPVIVEVQEPEHDGIAYWQKGDDDIGSLFRKEQKPYYCVGCRPA